MIPGQYFGLGPKLFKNGDPALAALPPPGGTSPATPRGTGRSQIDTSPWRAAAGHRDEGIDGSPLNSFKDQKAANPRQDGESRKAYRGRLLKLMRNTKGPRPKLGVKKVKKKA